jgi:hypothetical protein
MARAYGMANAGAHLPYPSWFNCPGMRVSCHGAASFSVHALANHRSPLPDTLDSGVKHGQAHCESEVPVSLWLKILRYDCRLLPQRHLNGTASTV